MSRPGDFMKSTSWLANAGHMLAGYGVILTTLFFSHRVIVVAAVHAAFFALVCFKEYYVDLRYESGEDTESSTIDAAGYMGGALAGWALWGLAHLFGAG
jgi:hypothetical protein